MALSLDSVVFGDMFLVSSTTIAIFIFILISIITVARLILLVLTSFFPVRAFNLLLKKSNQIEYMTHHGSFIASVS
ncbi:hypothetical protein Forpe1208_v009618 [Fusarium oxysporum f. sp. rapae]|uniref:Uncharacterized protein n=1 Tax=Fusarium oxysporum f. sp. rapae TaxID=485398 RepID=A0A8J5U703_FUSOX|nr:hypothetical protein Forpe1208_v009618 [Fusarium oxysporum f. sp. rapae]